MVHIALISLELAREHLSEVTNHLKTKKGLQHELVKMARAWVLSWKTMLQVKRRSFLTHAVKDLCWSLHDYEWLNMCLQMRDNAEALLSDRARQITCLSKEDDAEKLLLVVRSYWSLRDTAKAVENAAHTLLLVLSAAYKMSRIGGVKSRAMKVLVWEAHKVMRCISERRMREQ